MADGGLALAKLRAQGTGVAFAFGKNQDDLKPGRIAHVFEQDGCSASLMISLLGAAEGLGLRGGRLGGWGTFDTCLGGHGKTLLDELVLVARGKAPASRVHSRNSREYKRPLED